MYATKKTKDIARRKALEAIKQGFIKRKPCIICGDKLAYAHHPDYRRPLRVVFLCPYHHNWHHKVVEAVRSNRKRLKDSTLSVTDFAIKKEVYFLKNDLLSLKERIEMREANRRWNGTVGIEHFFNERSDRRKKR